MSTLFYQRQGFQGSEIPTRFDSETPAPESHGYDAPVPNFLNTQTAVPVSRYSRTTVP